MQKADDDLVFAHPHTGHVLDHSDLGRRYKKALKAGGVKDVRFNDLRHTFGARYADYCPSGHEGEMVERTFQLGTNFGTNLSETDETSEGLKSHEQAE